MMFMGFDPEKFYSGRSPLEAVSMGIKLADDDIAFRRIL
jgi:2,3-bisphosphoglycerate-independent phosphoglycerate mutase